MATLQLIQSRKITVVTTRGQKKEIEYAGREWGGLKDVLRSEGYNLVQMKAVEGTYRTTLEHAKAIMPEGNFNLFLMPQRSKSGAKKVVKKKVKKEVKKAVKKKEPVAVKKAKKALKTPKAPKVIPKKAAKKAAPSKSKSKSESKVTTPVKVKSKVSKSKVNSVPGKSDEELHEELMELADGFDDVRIN